MHIEATMQTHKT